jgi:hypothetical protein
MMERAGEAELAFSGFYALWIGVESEIAEDFQLAHSRDHLADHMSYLGPGGILWARRYTGGVGTLPPNFAFYGMAGLSRLIDPAYANARIPMSDWFRTEIGPCFRDRIPHHCDVLGTNGAGIGGAIATFIFEFGQSEKAAAALPAQLTKRPSITAAHIGKVNWQVPAAVGQPLPTRTSNAPLGVLVVESFDRHRLAAAIEGIAESMTAGKLATKVVGWAHYTLSYQLSYTDLVRHAKFTRQLGGIS